MDLSAHLRAILRRKWQILVASLLIAGLVFAWRSSAEKTYQASALLNVISGRAQAGASFTQQEALFLTQTYGSLAETRPVVEDGVRRSNLNTTVDDVQVSADSTQAGYLGIVARGSSPARAAAISQGVADALVAAVTAQQEATTQSLLAPVEAQAAAITTAVNALAAGAPTRAPLEAQLSILRQSIAQTQLRPVDRLTVVTAARAESAPVAPTPRRDALLALIAALIINSELAVLFSALGGRFTGDDIGGELAESTGLPVLAELPQGSGPDDAGVVEALRSLRTNLLFLNAEDGLGSLAVVGGQRGSGKSFVALNLARTLAGADTSVVLVDGDLRTPGLHKLLGVEAAPGLVDAMTPPYAPTTLKEVVGEPGMRLLPAGASVGDPAGLLGGAGFRHLLQSVKPGDMVVVDTPPLDLFADGAAIARSCDATVLVVDVRTIRRVEITKMVDILANVGVKPVGIVLNRVRGRNVKSYEEYRAPSRTSSNGSSRRSAKGASVK